jgi:hypothetical protein
MAPHRKRKAQQALEEDEPDGTRNSNSSGPFVLSAREHGSTPPPNAPFELSRDEDASARALLELLRVWGFDSRVGCICCTPVTISGAHCLLVSLRLVAAIAAVTSPATCICRNVTHLRSDPGIRRLQRDFWPWDASQEAKHLAEAALPLWPMKEICSVSEIWDEVRLFDVQAVAAHWVATAQGGCPVPASEHYLKALQRVVIRVAKSQTVSRHGHPRVVTGLGSGPSLALGRALSRGQVDEGALDALVTALGRTRAPEEHVGYGWSLTGTRMRSSEEIAHDDIHGHCVGAMEVLAQKAVPLPDLDLLRGPFKELARCPETGLEKWLQKNPEACRLLALSRGRRLVGSPQAAVLEKARDAEELE